MPVGSRAERDPPFLRLRQGFSWLGYATACVVGAVTASLVLVMMPVLARLAGDPSAGSGYDAGALSLVAVMAGLAVAVGAFLLLSPLALPLLAFMHRTGRTGRRHAVLGGMACAMVFALVVAAFGLTEDAFATILAGLSSGALAGLTYRAVAFRGGRRPAGAIDGPSANAR